MKIAIASTFHPYRGGIAAFNDRLAKSLTDIGHEVRCYNWSRQYPSILFPGETQTLTGHSTPSRSEAPLDSINPRSWKKTASLILEDGEVEVLLLPFWHASLAPALRGVARRVKRLSPSTKVIALMHNATSHDGSSVDKWLTKRFLKQVDSYVTLSDSVKTDVEKLAPGKRCTSLFHPLYDHYPSGIKTEVARQELGLPKDCKLALFFGLIRPYKGLDVLLKAMDDVDQNTHLLVAGECYGSWNKYQTIIDNSPAKGRIHLINRFIEESELPQIFSSADCLVLPYLKASQSGVVATAIHYNLPIVASSVGDLKSSVNPGVTGDLVNPGEPVELSSAINKVLSYDTDNASVEIAFNEIRKSKSWEAFAKQLFNLQ